MTWDSTAKAPAAARLAARLGLRLEDSVDSTTTRFLLIVGQDGVGLLDAKAPRERAIRVDFLSGHHEYRRRHGGGRKQALGRALGLRHGIAPRVMDATAGLGKDGFVLATLGCKVTLCERSPVLAALLEDGLARATDESGLGAWLLQRLEVWPGDSRTLLHNSQAANSFDAVYLDPMYPLQTGSALAKRELRTVRALVGSDCDASELLKLAVESTVRRVVVKRPLRGPALSGPIPSHCIRSAGTRYDVYLKL